MVLTKIPTKVASQMGHRQKIRGRTSNLVSEDRTGGRGPDRPHICERSYRGKIFANKVMEKVGETGRIIAVKILKEERWEAKEKELGCIQITLLDQQYILQLRVADPT